MTMRYIGTTSLMVTRVFVGDDKNNCLARPLCDSAKVRHAEKLRADKAVMIDENYETLSISRSTCYRYVRM